MSHKSEDAIIEGMNYFGLSYHYERDGQIGCYVQTEEPIEALLDACLGIQFATENWVSDSAMVWTTFYVEALPIVGFNGSASLEALPDNDYKKIDIYDEREKYISHGRAHEVAKYYQNNSTLEALIRANINGGAHILK